jgi:DNA invertase Pin-like site-specific DNA recombinase
MTARTSLQRWRGTYTRPSRLDRLKEIGAQFRSLSEDVNTTTPQGRAMMQMIGVFAEFEREIIRERTKSGLEEARRKGKVGGRPFKLDERKRCEIIKQVRTSRRQQRNVPGCSISLKLRYRGFSQGGAAKTVSSRRRKVVS